MHETEVVVGLRPVMEILRSDRPVRRVLIATSRQENVDEITALARSRGVSVARATDRQLDDAAAGERHQGIVAYVEPLPPTSIKDLIARAEAKGEPPFLCLLDGIEDVHNIGAVIRCADAAGVQGVVIPQRRSTGLPPGVHKTSAGATTYVPVVMVSSLAQAIETLHRHEVYVVGAAAEGKKDLWSANLRGPLAFVIGSEHEGMSHLVQERCDELVRIPMKGNVSSLNASVAAALLFFEKVRQDAAPKG